MGDTQDMMKPVLPINDELANEEDHEHQVQGSDFENDPGHSNANINQVQYHSSQMHVVLPDPILKGANTIDNSNSKDIVNSPLAVTNPHIQKLLDLRQKAQELSQRLNGIRQLAPALPPVSIELDDYAQRSILVNQPQQDDRGNDGLEDNELSEDEITSKHSASGRFGIYDDDGNADDVGMGSGDREVGDDDRWYGVSADENQSQGDEFRHQDPPSSSEEHNERDEMSSRLQNVTREVSRYDTNDLVDDDSEIDVRSIGVHSIAVVWPLGQQGNSIPTEESHLGYTEASSNSSDSEHDHDLSLDGSMPRGILVHSSDDSGSDLVRSRRKYDHFENSPGPSPIGKMSSLLRRSVDSVGMKFATSCGHLSDDYVGFATAAWRSDLQSPPGDAFFRLVQAEDDSLSIIHRTARRLFEKQQERERLKRENEEHRQVHDVLESSNEVSGGEHPTDEGREFTRLEEIIREVECEQIAERAGLESNESERDDESDSKSQLDDTNNDRPTAAPTEFWNQLISDATEQAGNEHVLPRRFACNVEIDTSELEMQREDSLRLVENGAENENVGFGGESSMPDHHHRRAHSPRTLAQRLLAEVEYHEAINEAHLKLMMMEQAQLLEQAQTETINIATAFKEEMEQNAVSHQLALDHATIEKRFDNDLEDVMHQLRGIEQLEEQQRAAYQEATTNELKQARLRECSVQTEEPRVADMGTSAPLHVDASTSPILPGVSVAVQYTEVILPKESSSAVENQGDKLINLEAEPTSSKNSAEREIAEYNEEEFEDESRYNSCSFAAQNEDIQSESDESKSAASVAEASDSASEIGDAASVSSAPKSNTTTSAEASEDIKDDAREPLEASSRSNFDEIVGSATVEYEDDFDASVATGEQSQPAAISEVDDDFDMESNYSQDTKTRSEQSTPNIEDAERSDIAKDDAPNVIESSNGGSIKDSIEDNFAESVGSVAASVDESSADVDEYEDDVETSRSSRTNVTQHVEAAMAKNNATAQPITFEARFEQTAAIAYGTGGYFAHQEASPLSDGSVPDQVVQAYMAELERRNQSEVSMLSLRMQAVESHFLAQTQRIDAALSDGSVDTAKKTEWTVRRQRLQIAFMSEKATIDSLKAAATARYYQDLLAFQSLLSENTTQVSIGGGTCFTMPGLGMSIPVQIQPSLSTLSHATFSAPANHPHLGTSINSEGYDDEFASITQDNEEQHGVFASEHSAIIEEEEAPASKDKPADNASVASEIEERESHSNEIIDVDDPPSDAYVNSDFEQDSEDQSSIDDQGNLSLVDDTTPPEQYVESEFETQVPAEIKEDSASEIDNVSEYSVSEIAHDDNIAEDGGSVDDEVGDLKNENPDDRSIQSSNDDEGGYDDDFASVSANVPDVSLGPPASDASIADDDIEEHQDESDAVSEDQHSVLSNYEDEDTPSRIQHVGDSQRDLLAEETQLRGQEGKTLDDAYSDDGFEDSGRHNSARDLEIPTYSFAEVTMHSASDDSSTTKLLMQEVKNLEGALADEETKNPDAESGKLERKKEKVLELLGAKEKLLEQQTRAFRVKEEMRLVNEAAHFALGLDISQELRAAKSLITIELQNEFDSIKQAYPRLKKMEQAPNIKSTKTATALGSAPVPSVVHTDQKASHQQIENSVDGEYNRRSFEDASRTIDNLHEDVPDVATELIDTKNIEAASDASQRYSDFGDDANEEINEVDETNEIADSFSEAQQSEIQSDVEEEEERDKVESEADSSHSLHQGKSDVEEYEDEYENDSFADAQSVASVVDEHETSAGDENNCIHSDVASVADPSYTVASVAASEAASEYTEDDFEAASDMEGAASNHDVESEEGNDKIAICEEDEELTLQEEQISVSEQELAADLAAVTSKLEESAPILVEDSIHIEQTQLGSPLDRADESVLELVPQALTPAADSHAEAHSSPASSEEESLTKSIEERVARLERLKALIEERQKDIRLVNRQMRTEKRKEALAVEESSLWEEAEGLERQLQIDVTSLELIRQRNRLEFCRLEAREQTQRLPSVGFCARVEHNFLDGFDYVEFAEPCEVASPVPRDVNVQVSLGVEVECQTIDRGVFEEIVVAVSRPADLLAAYEYVEEAEFVVAIMPEYIEEQSTGGKGIMESHLLSAGTNASGTEDSEDVLFGFQFIEAAEPVKMAEPDLLASFDYVEDVEFQTAVDDSEVLDGDFFLQDCNVVSNASNADVKHELVYCSADKVADQDIAVGESSINPVEDGQDSEIYASSVVEDTEERDKSKLPAEKLEEHQEEEKIDIERKVSDERDREAIQRRPRDAPDEVVVERISSMILSELLDDIGPGMLIDVCFCVFALGYY